MATTIRDYWAFLLQSEKKSELLRIGVSKDKIETMIVGSYIAGGKQFPKRLHIGPISILRAQDHDSRDIQIRMNELNVKYPGFRLTVRYIHPEET